MFVNPKFNDVAQFKEKFNYQSNYASKRNLLGLMLGGFLVVTLLVLMGIYFSGYNEREILGKIQSDNMGVAAQGIVDVENMGVENRFRFLDRYRGDLIDFYQIKTQELMGENAYLAATITLAKGSGVLF